MGKNKKTNKSSNSSDDIMLRLLDDSRIKAQDIELYNLAVTSFPNAKIADPIKILENKSEALETYNLYIKKTLETPGLTEEQTKKCLSNSYIRYYMHMLGLN
jgi:hypothetical protein